MDLGQWFLLMWPSFWIMFALGWKTQEWVSKWWSRREAEKEYRFSLDAARQVAREAARKVMSPRWVWDDTFEWKE